MRSLLPKATPTLEVSSEITLIPLPEKRSGYSFQS